MNSESPTHPHIQHVALSENNSSLSHFHQFSFEPFLINSPRAGSVIVSAAQSTGWGNMSQNSTLLLGQYLATQN